MSFAACIFVISHTTRQRITEFICKKHAAKRSEATMITKRAKAAMIMIFKKFLMFAQTVLTLYRTAL